MAIEYKLEGMNGIELKLKLLNGDVKVKGARTALRAAADLIKVEAISNAQAVDDPKTGEQIWKNVVVRASTKRFKQTGETVFQVGIMGGAKQYAKTRRNIREGKTGTYYTGGDKGNPGGDTWYWRFVEFGVPKKGIAGRSFLEVAMRAKSSAAIMEFSRRFDKYIDRKIRQASRVAK
jgi:HK97 gp10 family phage protein